tara:strand:- start:1356 stop:1763 length:408 start_codon:yes stop_codon:yes gene_type:complete
MAKQRQLGLDEQKAMVVGQVKALGIFPIAKILKDYYQMTDYQIEEMKDQLEQEMNDPVYAQLKAAEMGMPPPGMDPGMDPGMAPEVPMEGAPPAAPGETPPRQMESLDLENMKAMAIEAECDDELLRILEDRELG